MSSLNIGEPYLERTGDRTRLCSNIRWGDRARTLWFEVDRRYEDCLCRERIDGFLVTLLPFAMMNNLAIRSSGRVSERMLYQTRNVLLPSLSSNIPKLHAIAIEAESDGRVLESRNGVGTALSCGVDSFYTVLKHLDTDTPGFNLTHVTYFNIMNHSQWKGYGEEHSRDFFKARIDYVRPAAQELGLELVTVDMNGDLFYHDYDLLETFSFRTFGPVLALQKLFAKYYWSSGYSLSSFKLSLADVSLFDLLSVQCVSNENTTIFSVGSEACRLEKTSFIADHEITRRYLNVCWNELHNCSDRCDKCKRTMLSLYVLGKLELYSKVFDVGKFHKSIDEYVGYMLHRCSRDRDHSFYWEICDDYLRMGYMISWKARLHAARETLVELAATVRRLKTTALLAGMQEGPGRKMKKTAMLPVGFGALMGAVAMAAAVWSWQLLAGNLAIVSVVLAFALAAVVGIACLAYGRRCVARVRNVQSQGRRKYHSYYLLLSSWMKLQHEGKRLSQYFENNGLQDIAVYGLGRLGLCLCDELKNSQVRIRYCVDADPGHFSYLGTKVLSPDDQLEEVDAIIITPICEYGDIATALKGKTRARTISLEDVVASL